jgi:xyloglucan-specific endo-beta-1,4-glucanase
VKSYPYAGKNFTPKLVSQISSLPTTFSWSYSGSNIRANVAYDLFTSANRNNPTYTGDYELMIWMAALGNVGPISATGNPIATVTLAGHSWRLYYGLNGAMKVYSFVYNNGQLANFSGDVKAFWNYLVSSHGFPQNNQYLLSK